ncbi:DoxX family protein [Ornithinimicrobium cavernae]|uniref:DoxX family protein n=1 Tax=Ornithinimicrobium cavernae TaxID=2666047 RepID=UPI000D68E217|nr:DoxX family protein [Ornithinimicrobium cavernae]
MDLALWIASGALALVFAASGTAKLVMSRQRMLDTGQTGIAPFPMHVVRLTAASELLAAVGLFAPWLTDTARVLTPLAAVGLIVVMCGAAVSHASLREPKAVAENLALLLTAAFVAAGRFAALG